MSPPGRLAFPEWALMLLCVLAGGLFFTSLDDLWPLAEMDLVVPGSHSEQQAREFLVSRGFDLGDYQAASELTVDTRALDHVQRSCGLDRTQAFIRSGLPLVLYRVTFKRSGERTAYTVRLHPTAGVLGWRKWLEEDTPGARLSVDAARELALEALVSGLNLERSLYSDRSAASSEQSDRLDHSFGFERTVSTDPELIERVRVTVGGNEVIEATRTLFVPGAARREARIAEAPGRALETAGFVLLTLAILAAFHSLLTGLKTGAVEIKRAAVWPAVVFVCLLGTYALETASLFRYWEPLWPYWVSTFRYLSFRAAGGVLLAILLFTVVASGDALDRTAGYHRGASLWALARGKLFDPGVIRASRRGFPIGLLCGGVLAASVLLIGKTTGVETSIQPRGFFFYTLNTASPLATSLLFFLGIALVEELGYRFFMGTWLLSISGRRWLAIGLPAIIYGLTHTGLDFLPPAEPWWARALVLALVGAVWGWAFFRFDALTVVLSHFTADLFIFNWPRLASGEPEIVALAIATICVPLIPAVLGLRPRIT